MKKFSNYISKGIFHSMSIVIKIQGGLGNQLFQYAFARSLSYRTQQELLIDKDSFIWSPSRKYTLDKFDIKENLFDIKNKLKFELVKELDENFNFEYMIKNGNYYFDGYFQSYYYFSDCMNVIQKDFNLKNKSLIEQNTYQSMLNLINKSDSIALNVRRGDYTRKDLLMYHGVCPLTYYTYCINECIQLFNNPVFFIFSDDIEWVEENLEILRNVDYHNVSIPYLYHTDGNAINVNDYIDLYIISQCKNHILSNSTFAWWGAWLSEYIDKKVFYYNKWYENGKSIKDLIPPDWIKCE